MRRISLVLDGSARDNQSVQATMALALRLGAQVEALFIRPSVGEILARFGDSIASSISGDIIEQILKDADEFAGKAKLNLEDAARANGLTVFKRPSRLSAPGVSFEVIQGPPLAALDAAADLSDLVVFGEPDHVAPTPLTEQIEYMMLTLRRPVLVARGEVAERLGDRVVVAFDGRHEACTALLRTVPILAAARSVEILHVCEHEGHDVGRADRALRYLGQNGINASAVEAELSNKEVGVRLLELAKMSKADLIVMGGFGRSRMRELILGGATRHMMHHAQIPVLFAH
ncbi:MAG: universal stress protein [Alphaproteobacteria bacterium]